MCGRYYVNAETEKEIRQIVDLVDRKLNMSYGDVHPSEDAVILTEDGRQNLIARKMKWGFPSFASGQLLINARSETALEKKSFSESVMKRRCVIPVSQFYEWNKEKVKVTFQMKNRPFYLAGFYNRFESGERFIILTSPANTSMQPVHDRMPVIIEPGDIRKWIFDGSKLNYFLSKNQPELSRIQEYEQLTLF